MYLAQLFFFLFRSPSNCRIPSGEFRNHELILKHHMFLILFSLRGMGDLGICQAGIGDFMLIIRIAAAAKGCDRVAFSGLQKRWDSSVAARMVKFTAPD